MDQGVSGAKVYPQCPGSSSRDLVPAKPFSCVTAAVETVGSQNQQLLVDVWDSWDSYYYHRQSTVNKTRLCFSFLASHVLLSTLAAAISNSFNIVDLETCPLWLEYSGRARWTLRKRSPCDQVIS